MNHIGQGASGESRKRDVVSPWLKWISVAAAAGLLGLTVLLSGALQREADKQLSRQVETEVQWVRAHFEAAVRERVNAIERMAQNWETDSGKSQVSWRRDAEAHLRDLPDGFAALQWIDAQDRLRWIVPDGGGAAALQLHASQQSLRADALQRAPGASGPVFSGQMTLAQGGPGMLLVRPLLVKGRQDGALIAVLRTGELFARLSEETAARGYGLAVSSAGAAVYRRGETPSAAAVPARGLRFDSGESTWEITLWPTAAMYAMHRPVLPRLVLASGLVLVLLLALAFALWGLSDQRARLIQRANHALQRSEDLLERTGELANVGGWELELPAGVPRWTAQTYRIHDMAAGVPFNAEDAHMAYAPQARPIIRKAVEDAIEHGTPFDLELPLITARGRHIWVRALGRAQVKDGKTVGLTGALQDITERRQAEQLLRNSEAFTQSVLDSMPSQIAVIDRDGVIEAVNASWRRFALENGVEPGKSSPTTGVGANYLGVCHASRGDWSEGATEARAGILAILEGRALSFNLEYPCHAPNKQRWFVMYAAPLAIERGGAVIAHIDITARKQVEAALLATKEDAVRASQAKSEFLSSMSHELRTPMNAVLGFAQLMEVDQELAPEHRECLGEILKAGRRLMALIDHVLNFSTIEQDKVKLSIESVACAALVDECLGMVAALTREHGIRLQCGDLDQLVVRADRLRLRQALLNLLSNAIQYNRPDGSVRVHAAMADGGLVRLLVTDTGPGIAPDRQAELFQPFSRLDAGMGTIAGTGVGLVIARRVVELMGGRVDFQSEVDVGSTFWIELPGAAGLG